MQAVPGVVVDVVQVQAGGALVHFHRLVMITQLGRQDAVHAGGQAAFMHCKRLVEIKVAADGFHIVEVIEEIHALQHVRLLDVAGAEDAVPAPVLVDGAFLLRDGGSRLQFLVQEGVVLHENAQLLILRVIHAGNHPAHPLHFLRGAAQFAHALFAHPGGCLQEVFQAPGSHAVGVPVVVHVVLVFVGAGYTVDHVLPGMIAVMHPPQPEPGNPQQHLDALVPQILLIAGVGGIVEDSIGYSGVAVDFLKGNLPLVVALHAGEGHHGIQRAGQALLPRVVIRALQLLPAVQQQLPRHLLPRHRHVHRQAVGLGIPVGGSAILFAGEALGTDIQPGVLTGISAHQLEQVEADALLRAVIALNLHVRHGPPVGPGSLLAAQGFLPALPQGGHSRLPRQAGQFLRGVVTAGVYQGKLVNARRFPGFHLPGVQACTVAGFCRVVHMIQQAGTVAHGR